jgi:hypothetical protein
MNFLPRNLTRFVRPFLLILMLTLMFTLASASYAAVFISVTVAPPPLPVYVQPPCPEPGYLWIPGYWAWGPYGYYWVPGYWAPAPNPGYYWTPGYWGWDDVGVAFIWHGGYWGPHVGFYGGVNYGFGFFGEGFVGGEWRGDRFFYNRAVVNINETRITNVFVNRTVIVNRTENHVSFNGGVGGIRRAPTQFEQAAQRDRHIDPTPLQVRHRDEAERNPQFQVKNNGGRPPVAATVRPGDFRSGAVPARATGGRVDTAVLNATPKTMPPPRRGPEMQGREQGGPANRPEATGGGRPFTPGRTETGRPETGRPETGGNRPFTPGGRPEAGRPETGRPETGRPENARPETGGGRPFTPGRAENNRPEGGGNRPFTPGGPGGRPETGRPENTGPAERGRDRSFAPSGRPEGGRPETGGGRPLTPSGRPEGGRPDTGNNRPFTERPGGAPERNMAPPRNEPMRQERSGPPPSQFNQRPERQAPSRPESSPRSESRPAPQPMRQAPPSHGNAPQQHPQKESHGGGQNDHGDHGDHGDRER